MPKQGWLDKDRYPSRSTEARSRNSIIHFGAEAGEEEGSLIRSGIEAENELPELWTAGSEDEFRKIRAWEGVRRAIDLGG